MSTTSAETIGVVEVEKEHRLDAAANLISTACAWSAGAGLLPIPVLDLVALAAVQSQLCSDIAELYGQYFSKEASKSIVSVLWGTLVPGVLGSGLKSVPGLGYILGSVTFGAFAAGSTYAVGKVMVRHFENGGTSNNFDASQVGADLKREFVRASKSSSTNG
ncbi:MAG: YcjF family protein [Methylophilaceae bacterium]